MQNNDSSKLKKRVGMTTTVPVEAVYAAGCTPVDLNNIFINSENRASLVSEAEYQGYPRNACGWIKGIYSVASKGAVDTLIAVVEGDCSQTKAMVESLTMQGIDVIPFAFPYGRDREVLRVNIEKLIEQLGTTWEETVVCKARLDEVRRKVWRLDELTWQRGTVSSLENHYYQVSCSDFNGNPDAFAEEVDVHIRKAENAPERKDGLRLGYLGVPPIFTDLYGYIESLGARVVFNEIQRQFSMPFNTDDLIEQYALYTYPYDVFARIEDIKREIKRRNIAGLIHYTQSFCFRQIQDMILRKHLNIPILTLEGDSPSSLDARTKVRIESFVEMLT